MYGYFVGEEDDEAMFTAAQCLETIGSVLEVSILCLSMMSVCLMCPLRV